MAKIPHLFFLIVLTVFTSCNNSDINTNQVLIKQKQIDNSYQDSIITLYHKNCALNYNYRYQMLEWQNCLDKGLAIDSTIAYLWQKKAMPYFKARKYEVGMAYLDKAVKYNPERWLAYRGFIKCIFSKQYNESIKDFERILEIDGNSYVMDHTYKFHIALSYLQLNKLSKAEVIFEEDIASQEKDWGEAHFVDTFYLGITKYELGKWNEAIKSFDKSLSTYTNFAEAKFYTALCLYRLGKRQEAEELMIDAKIQGELGNTFNEDNSIYEPYPYQIKW